MLFLLSPAKSLNQEPLQSPLSPTSTRLDKKSAQLASKLRGQSLKSLKSLMKISDDLAKTNRDRYQELSFPVAQESGSTAVHLFNGDVYRGLNADTLTAAELEYAQDHVRILSGLYGLLRPLDLMQPYRLEMGTKLEYRNHKNLYSFWGEDITKLLINDLKDVHEQVIINLASNEYFKAVKPKLLNCPIITINFRELRDGKVKFISFNAKVARGLMTRYAIDHAITNHQDLKSFNYEGYEFIPEESTEHEWMFLKS